MNPITDLVVTLRIGERELVVEARELERTLDFPGLRYRLIGLTFSGTCPQIIHEREGGKGVVRVSQVPERKRLREYLPSVSVLGKGKGSGGRENPTPVDTSEAFAAYLAEKLSDHGSLNWYRHVVRRLPREQVEEALRRACDLEPHQARRSRAALFTWLVRAAMRHP